MFMGMPHVDSCVARWPKVPLAFLTWGWGFEWESAVRPPRCTTQVERPLFGGGEYQSAKPDRAISGPFCDQPLCKAMFPSKRFLQSGRIQAIYKDTESARNLVPT